MHKIKSPSGSQHLKHTRSAFLRLSSLLPLSLSGCENGLRDSELWQRFQRVTWGKGSRGEGVGGSRESNLIPLFILQELDWLCLGRDQKWPHRRAGWK